MDPTLLIGDIVERKEADVKRPVEFSDAAFEPTPTGFPKHRRRWRPTKKPEQATTPDKAASNDAPAPGGFDEAEKRRIDSENRQRINDMTPDEIAQAQEDIMSGLNPALVQRLLRRANLDQEDTPAPPPPKLQQDSKSDQPSRKTTVEDEDSTKAAEPKPKVRFAEPEPRAEPAASTRPDPADDRAPATIPPDLFPITDQPKNTHFPVPPPLPDLDPSDPDFMETLHKKYFPELPADPSKMAWMAPVPTEDSVADKESPYYPHPEISVSALRFDFRGRFLSPRVSRTIASSKGLHHHGEAPEAAGYTVAELAHLARSAVPAQRCMAFQTLGRILYRLGQGDWGKTIDDPIAMGIWSAVKEGRVLDSLTEAAMAEGGHRGSRAYATEALWLFEKGGWKEKFQGR